MNQRARSARKLPGRTRPESIQSHPTWLPPGRECPWCGSRDTVFVQRGLAGGQESRDQYIRCHDCGKVTYDIIARDDRQIRLGRLRAGAEYRDIEHQTRYTIYRMLKVGFNEFLLYVRPILPDKQ